MLYLMEFPILIKWTNPFRILGLLRSNLQFIQIVKVHSVSKMSRSAKSDLDLHCLLTSLKKENRLKLFSNKFIQF